MKRLTMVFLLISLLMGTTLVMMSKHWFPIWLGLELSTLSIMPLLKTSMKSRSKEATMKYFLVQAFSAALLLKGATLSLWLTNSWTVKEMFKAPMCYLMMLLAIMMKLGLAPCHFWFPDVLSGMSFLNGMMMACWQKIAPLFILMKITKKITKEMILMCATISVLVGGWGGLNQTSTRKMLAYSSISHLGWMTATMFFVPEMAMLLFIFYMLKNTLGFLMCHNKNLSSLSNLKKTNTIPVTSLLFSMTLLSLGGLPPLGGFLKKLVPLMMFTEKLKNLFLPFLMFGSLTSLYFYLRVVFKTSLTLFPKNSLSMIKTKNPTKKKINFFISALAPFTMWGILLLPMIWSFM